MTRQRKHGTESDFSTWCRLNPRLDAQTAGIYLCDIDLAVLNYKRGITFLLEVKTRLADVGRFQRDLLEAYDQNIRRGSGAIYRTMRGNRKLHFCGVFRLILQNTDPDNSQTMFLGRIDGPLYKITSYELERILGSVDDPIAPDNWIALKELEQVQDKEEAA